MQKVAENLFIGTDMDCRAAGGMAVIHACKTCHAQALGYRGSLPSSHPNYLIYEVGNNLFLNMVDMARLMPLYTDPIMNTALQFIEKHIQTTPVLIHCNQGVSRSPGIGLLYMAKKGLLPNASYEIAKAEFRKIYPFYNPATGIDNYLNENWVKFIS